MNITAGGAAGASAARQQRSLQLAARSEQQQEEEVRAIVRAAYLGILGRVSAIVMTMTMTI
eukprot:COSAG01_NODE_2951_length_6804_cov_32.584489_10_plen_61_part_00